jgi:hypothetical protein
MQSSKYALVAEYQVIGQDFQARNWKNSVSDMALELLCSPV